MSFLPLRKFNRGARASPFSGVGLEFLPLGMPPDQSGVILHEAGYLPRNDWWNFPNIFSPFWRVYYNSRPGHKITFQGADFELTPDSWMIIPAHQLHHTSGRKPVPHCWMTFEVARHLEPRQKIPICLRPTKAELLLLRQFCDCFKGIGKGDRERILHTSLALLHLLLIRPEIQWQPKWLPDSLHRSLRRIETDYARNLTLPELARTAGLSVHGFSKSFKQYQGVTPGRFLTQVRIRESAHLLINTKSTIDQIAERSGFPNRHYFSRVFKRVTGDSPAHFRSQHGG